MNFCPNCGCKLQPGFFYCPQCSHKLSEEPETDQPSHVQPTAPPQSGDEPPPVKESKLSVLAIASLLLGLIGVLSFNFVGIIGLILGILAISKIKKFPDQIRGKESAIAGVIISAISVILFWRTLSMSYPIYSAIVDIAIVALAIGFLANSKFKGKVKGIFKLNPEKKTASFFAGIIIPVFLFFLFISFMSLISNIKEEKQAKIRKNYISKIEQGYDEISKDNYNKAKSSFKEALAIKEYKDSKSEAKKGLLITDILAGKDEVSKDYIQERVKNVDNATLSSILNEDKFPAVFSTGNDKADAKLKELLPDIASKEKSRRDEKEKKRILEKADSTVKKLKDSWTKIKKLEEKNEYKKALSEFSTLNAQIKIINKAISYGFEPDKTTSSIISDADSKKDSIIKKKKKAEEERKRKRKLKKRKKENSKYIKKLKKQLSKVRNFNVEDCTSSKDSILLCASRFSGWAETAEEGKEYNLFENQEKILSKFKRELSSLQRKALPRLRDAYGPVLRKELWENDISAKTIGKGYKIIEFVGGVFAANRNIKSFQEGLTKSKALIILRFNRTRYKWYKRADEYTYYDIDTPKDSDLVVFTDGGGYKVIE